MAHGGEKLALERVGAPQLVVEACELLFLARHLLVAPGQFGALLEDARVGGRVAQGNGRGVGERVEQLHVVRRDLARLAIVDLDYAERAPVNADRRDDERAGPVALEEHGDERAGIGRDVLDRHDVARFQGTVGDGLREGQGCAGAGRRVQPLPGLHVQRRGLLVDQEQGHALRCHQVSRRAHDLLKKGRTVERGGEARSDAAQPGHPARAFDITCGGAAQLLVLAPDGVDLGRRRLPHTPVSLHQNRS